jgi:hypothetical protein
MLAIKMPVAITAFMLMPYLSGFSISKTSRKDMGVRGIKYHSHPGRGTRLRKCC